MFSILGWMIAMRGERRKAVWPLVTVRVAARISSSKVTQQSWRFLSINIERTIARLLRTKIGGNRDWTRILSAEATKLTVKPPNVAQKLEK